MAAILKNILVVSRKACLKFFRTYRFNEDVFQARTNSSNLFFQFNVREKQIVQRKRSQRLDIPNQ
jgi:hypothetical protein